MKMPKISFKKEDMIRMAKAAKAGLTDNAPVISAGLAVAGVGLSIWLTIKATKKYGEEIEELKEAKMQARQEAVDNGESELPSLEVSKKERTIVALKCGIPVIIVGSLTITGICFSVWAANKKIKGLSVMLAGAEAAMSRTDVSIEEIVGPKKATEIEMAANKKMLEATNEGMAAEGMTPPWEDDGLIEHSDLGGCTLMYDAVLNKYFYGDITAIGKGLNEFTSMMMEVGFASVNEYRDALGLSHVGWGDYIGWEFDVDGMFRYEIEYDPNVNKRATAIVKPKVWPRRDWRNS